MRITAIQIFASGKATLPVLILCLVLLTVYRGFLTATSDLSLYFDEAYYWFWSNSLAYGYFSKPPMIAWVIHATSMVCGDGEACVRSGALLLFPLTSGLIYLIGARLFDRRVGFWSGLLFATLPFVSFYSRLMTTDSLLLFFWSLCLYSFIRAIDGDRWSDWLVAGIALGGGMLSKYTMGFFLLSVLIYCSWEPDRRKLWRNPKTWWALCLAFAIFAPNLLWNRAHRFASFRHTAEIAQWNGDLLHFDKLLEFVGGQFLLVGPPLGAICTILATKYRRILLEDGRARLLLAFTAPILLTYCGQALLAKANLNWAVAAYAPASVLAVAGLLRFEWKRSLKASLAVNLLLSIGIYHYVAIARSLEIPLSRHSDLYTELYGWRELGDRVGAVMARYPEVGLLCDNRRVMSELIYYIKPHPLDASVYNPTGQISDHFRLTADISTSRRKSFLFVAMDTHLKRISSEFREVEDLGEIEVPIYDDHSLKYRLFRVTDFRGYGS